MATAFGQPTMATPLLSAKAPALSPSPSPVTAPKSAPATPAVRYSPGRRALVSRDVNSVWMAARTPTPAKRLRQAAAVVRAFSHAEAETPVASPPVGWIQRAAIAGVTPQASAALHASPANLIGADISAIMRDGGGPSPSPRPVAAAEIDDDDLLGEEAIEQAIAGVLREFAATVQDAGCTPGPAGRTRSAAATAAQNSDAVPVGASPLAWLSTPSDVGTPHATPAGLQPTISASGGFEVTPPHAVQRKLSPTPQRISPGVGGVPCGAAPAAWLSTAISPVATTSQQSPPRERYTAPPPRYSCCVVGAREVCMQDPLHPVAYPQTFCLFSVEVALPDPELGRAKLVVAEKRYSEFVALDAELREWVVSEHLGSSARHWSPTLPPKRLWPTRASIVAERKLGLQNYLDWIVTLEATRPRRQLLDWLLQNGSTN
eukprot:COSAG06_NODE_29_length_31823_cov_17.447106_5_plen_432_part_00